MSETKTSSGTALAAPPAAGTIQRREFGAQQLARSAETASSAAAAQAQAVVQARYIVAMQNRRDWDEVRVRLLAECKRPGFAEVAYYRKPLGEGVEGLSIRFAEAAIRCMGNLLPEAPIVYDDPERRILRVLVTDLESNVTYTKDIVIDKTVERRSLRKGQEALGMRVNSRGEPTYLVRATEDDMLGKEGAAVSKATRTLALRILPGDLQDECKRLILDARRGADVKDPSAGRKKVADSFAELGVTPAMLKRFLGHELGTCSPAELEDLRGLWSAIKNGETTWAAIMEEHGGEDDTERKAGLDAVKDKLKEQAGAGGSAPASDKLADQPPACEHVTLPKQRLEAMPRSKTVACPDCGQEFTGAARVPGEDDDEGDPAAAPDSAIASGPPSVAEKKDTPAKKGQRKLEEA